jgi:hypothetical protein
MFRKNVASQNIPFLLIKAADGTALTGATVTAYRCIDGAAQAAVTGSVTEKANGQYLFAPSQADMNGNNIGFLFTATSAIPVHITIVTTAADPTDSVRFGLTSLPNAAASAVGGLPVAVDTSGRVDVLKINGTSQTARDIGASVLLSSGTGTGQLSLSAGLVTLAGVTHTGAVIPTVTTTTNLTNAPTAGDFTSTMKTSLNAATPASVTTVTGNVNGSVASCAAATLTGDLTATMKSSVTAAVPTAGSIWDVTLASHLTAGTTGNALNAAGAAGDPWTTAIPGAYGAGTAGSIVGNNLNAKVGDVKAKTDNLPASPAAVGSNMGTVTSVTGAVGSVTTVSDKTGYSLTVTPPTAVQVRTEMDSNSTKLANLDATVSSRLSPAGTLATVTTLTNAPTDSASVVAIKAKTDQLIFTGGNVNANATVDTSSIAGAVWDVTNASHLTAGTTGKALSTASSGGVDISALASGVWNEPLAAHPTAGTAGKVLASAMTVIGSGNTAVNENTGGTDNLRYVDSGGNGVDNGSVEVYQGNNLMGSTTTKADGRWLTSIYLDTGFTYRIDFYKQGVYQTSSRSVVI